MHLLLLYVPVWHKGYQLLFDEVAEQVDEVWLVDAEWARREYAELDYLRKEIRTVDAEQMKQVIESLYPKLRVMILNEKTVDSLQQQKKIISTLIIPAEDVSKVVARALLPQAKAEEKPVFLRWDRARATTTAQPKVATSNTVAQLAEHMLTKAYEAAAHSSDWWRHVGAVLAQGETVLFAAANRHLPTDQAPYVVGDVRQLFHQGEYMDYSTAEHAETAVIAECARQGTATKGSQLYCTTFPCPYCARLIAHAGVSDLYFAEGYATLDGETILTQAGVTIHQVKLDPATLSKQDSNSTLLPYPSN